MSIVRDLGIPQLALVDTAIVTCSTADQTVKSTGNVVQSSTAANGVSGRIIDRISDGLVSRYPVAQVLAWLNSTRGSTELNRQLTLGVKLQHGDSSGGGDMADYSTGSAPVDQTFFTTARSTDHAAWSTGAFIGQTNPATYDLRAAKRYLRPVVFATKNKVTTESSGDESFHIGAAILFGGGDQVPQNAFTGAGSTSTST